MGWMGGGTLLVVPKFTHRKAAAYCRGDLPEKDRAFEGDMVQCKHCQYMWYMQPGSGTKRGWCTSCSGVLCLQTPRCAYSCSGGEHFMKVIEHKEAKNRWLMKLIGG